MRTKDWVLLVFCLFLLSGVVSGSGSARRVDELSGVTLGSSEQDPTLPESSAGILLADELHGRFSVRDRDRDVVAEVVKPLGRSIELLLEPGTYGIYLVQEGERFIGSCELGTGEWIVLHLNKPQHANRKPPTIRQARPRAARFGAEPRMPAPVLSLAKRHRIEFRVGYWDSGSKQDFRSGCSDLVDTEVHDLLGAFSYAYWIREDFAVQATFRGLVAEARSASGWYGGCENTVVISSLILGIRQYPFSTLTAPVRPYLTAGIGPYWGVESWNDYHFDGDVTTRTEASFGGHLGGGLDIQMGRHLMAGINVGYNLMADFPNPLAGDDNYGGVEVGVGFGLLLGRGTR